VANQPLCPYCLRWHHPVDFCEPEASLPAWTGIDPGDQRRADLAESNRIRVYRSLRQRRA
jgi:hypothetical protein